MFNWGLQIYGEKKRFYENRRGRPRVPFLTCMRSVPLRKLSPQPLQSDLWDFMPAFEAHGLEWNAVCQQHFLAFGVNLRLDEFIGRTIDKPFARSLGIRFEFSERQIARHIARPNDDFIHRRITSRL